MSSKLTVPGTSQPVPPAPSCLAFGAFKIGRNQGVKYETPYDLPDDADVARLLHGVLDLGTTLIDTAPAYGLSEERIGRHLASRRNEFLLSTKVGETFLDGRSTFDFSAAGIRLSVERSLQRLQTDRLDLLLLHSDGRDLELQDQTDAIATLIHLRQQGLAQRIGLSGKTVAGAQRAFEWADVLMVEYHLDDVSHAEILATAHERGTWVLVKKGLSSGRLPPTQAIEFVLRQPAVTSLVVGGLSLDHYAQNWQTAHAVRSLG